jgi:hypothetical protein
METCTGQGAWGSQLASSANELVCIDTRGDRGSRGLAGCLATQQGMGRDVREQCDTSPATTTRGAQNGERRGGRECDGEVSTEQKLLESR